jgi:hypothetical protein
MSRLHEASQLAAAGARRMLAKFPGKCAHCFGAVQTGEEIIHVRAAHKAFHVKCWETMQDNEAKGTQASVASAASAAAGMTETEVRAMIDAAVAKAMASVETRGALSVEVRLPDMTAKDMGRQHRQYPTLVAAVGAGLNVWIAGPAGGGKTTAAEACAIALGLPFSADGALDTEYKVSGFTDAQGRIVSTAFRKAYTEGGLHLFDECDASLAGATLAMNAALANGFAMFPDGMKKRHPDFRCIAAANTWGLGATFDYVGRNKLDAAFLDRFVTVAWDYDESLERDIASNREWTLFVQERRSRARRAGLKVVISPRASLFGGILLKAGMDRETVIDLTMRAKMRAEDWKAIA